VGGGTGRPGLGRTGAGVDTTGRRGWGRGRGGADRSSTGRPGKGLTAVGARRGGQSVAAAATCAAAGVSGGVGAME
jgi:hypothetical protein